MSGRGARVRPARTTRAGLSTGNGRNERVWTVVAAIPRGCVATYRQVANLAGIEGPGAARQAGYALAALPRCSGVPWHRVINARGLVSPRREDGRAEQQYALLAREGVKRDAAGRIDLARYEWSYGI